WSSMFRALVIVQPGWDVVRLFRSKELPPVNTKACDTPVGPDDWPTAWPRSLMADALLSRKPELASPMWITLPLGETNSANQLVGVRSTGPLGELGGG